MRSFNIGGCLAEIYRAYVRNTNWGTHESNLTNSAIFVS
jgi:hypothetical protein